MPVGAHLVRKENIMLRNATLTALLISIATVGAGCQIFGFDHQLDKRGQIEATIDSIAQAGESQDEMALEEYLATTVVTKILNGDGYQSESTEGKTAVIQRLKAMWANMSTNRISVQLTDLSLRGADALTQGSFTLDFEDATGNRAECVGTGTATFSQSDAGWMVTGVTVVESRCELIPPDDPTPDPGSDPVPPGVPHYSAAQCRYLTLGMGGTQVRAVQESLNYLGYSAGRIDGDYGPITERAVRRFQMKRDLYVDGEFGPKTTSALNERLGRDGGYFLCASVDDSPDAGETFVSYTALRRGTPFETQVIQYESPNPGPTLVFVGCIHGNEQSGNKALIDAIDRGITLSRGRVVVVPELNRLACENNRRTLSYSGSLLAGKDFNRMFPVGERPTYLIARELWDLIRSQPDLAFVVDFHDGFVNSLANTLLHTRQSKAATIADMIRDNLNDVRPSGTPGPSWDAYPEPISGSLIRKVGRDLGVPGILAELAGRNPGDPLRLRKEYAWRLMRLLGAEHDMVIAF